ncbi:hypothetical protein [Pseudomonas sp. R5(2019)]|uniref:hypothetical protein n=1 Tax=Pseudomonas sp. R5(2019) TaxID=2697566 RepID=UPI001412498C|nr:hypothetical protein [Pseudomonas sp. R5(2019)]NBA95154.1 hypothetical protein [Pseudomonas sp. R5(2019)]
MSGPGQWWIKGLTKPLSGQQKSADQKTTTPIKATEIKASSHMLPSYPQSAPQQPWTTSPHDKSMNFSDVVSRFAHLTNGLSTKLWMKENAPAFKGQGVFLTLISGQ